MREIKFRVWSTISKPKMINWADLFESSADFLIESFEWKVMQYTGLKDRNGKEIYEGDVVTCQMTFEDSFLPHMGEITFVEDFGAFATKNEAGETLLHKHQLNTFEIIGNIYENPELLEG